jgi:WD40 repeat protein
MQTHATNNHANKYTCKKILMQGGSQKRFFTGHTAVITCISVDASGKLAATGQTGPNSKVCVWGTEDCVRIAELPSLHPEYAVSCLAWCADGVRIAAVEADPLHTLCVWKVRGVGGEQLLHSCPTDTLAVLAVGWNPFVSEWIVTAGEQHVRFWKLKDAQVVGRRGGLGVAGCHVTAACVAFVEKTGADSDPEIEATYTLTGMMDGR